MSEISYAWEEGALVGYPTYDTVKKFRAPMPPNVQKVRVKHMLGTRDVIFALTDDKGRTKLNGYSVAYGLDFLDFHFYNGKLGTGYKIVVVS